MQKTILAIETSCDETAVAIVQKSGSAISVLSNVVSSQIALHAPFGGVVPNLAAREHVKNIVPVIESALRETNASKDAIEAIAVTAGPGLMPALQIGVTAAKTLSYLWKKPLLPIHHIEGHIYANFICKPPTTNNQQPTTKQERRQLEIGSWKLEAGSRELEVGSWKLEVGSRRLEHPFPLLALVVSGGHTELILMRDHFDYEILGETEDDAVGEAFDKVAKMLNLPYPGGPEIAQRANNFQIPISDFESNSNSKIQPSFKIQNSKSISFSFPRPLMESNDYRFSFSGLKTSVLYFLKKHEHEKHDENFINAVCHEFQEAALDVLIEKTRHATLEYQPKTIIIAGGVSANVELRKRMGEMITRNFSNTSFLMPPFSYSLDNASMIGAAALFRFERMNDEEKKRALTIWQTLEANPNMKLSKYTT